MPQPLDFPLVDNPAVISCLLARPTITPPCVFSRTPTAKLGETGRGQRYGRRLVGA